MPNEDVSALTTSSEASPDRIDEIANLLVDDSDTTDSEESTGQSDESTLEEEESNEEEVVESNDAEEDDSEDVTWGSALGLNDDQIVIDEDGNLTGVNVKVDGKSSSVALNDLLAGYQTNKHNTVKSQTLAEERKKFEEATQGFQQQYQEKLNTAEAMSKYLEKKLLGEFEGINWEELRSVDPAEYAAARQDYATRAQEIQSAQSALSQEQLQQKEKSQKEFHTNHMEYLEGQKQKMLSSNPTWNSQEVFEKDMTQLKSFLGNQYGFQNSDFDTISDARIIEVLKDAQAYRTGKVKTQAKLKKAPVAKFQKSSGRKAPRISKLDKLTKAAKNAKGGSNRRLLQADAVAELLMSGE